MNNKIVCIGRNYLKHAEELGNEVPEFPLIFLKPFSSLIKSGEKIFYPNYSNDMHYEAELVLVIGKDIYKGNKEEAENSISGYAVGLDMTLRDIQDELKKKGYPWTLAKVFNGSAVISEIMPKCDYTLTLNEKIVLEQNGMIKQNSPLNKMIFNPTDIIEYISSKMTLKKGDLIFTGTPEGVGKTFKGDKLKAKIDNIAELYTEIL